MNTIAFFAAGTPKGQPRPRAFAINGSARVFDPGTAEFWKSQIAVAAKPHLPPLPEESPVHLKLVFHMPRPKKHYTKKGLRPDAPLWFSQKPDADNLAKAVMDAMTTLGFWKDDSQVVSLVIEKTYTEKPGVDVTIQPVPCANSLTPSK